MSSSWRELNARQVVWGVLLFSFLLTFAGLNVRELESGDETRVAGIAAEMVIERDWLLPKLNGAPFLEYPPLYYWSEAAAFEVWGINDFAAKVPSALAAMIAGLLVTCWALRLRFPPWAAGLSGIFFLTGAQVVNNSRKAMVDMMLAMFVLLSVYAFARLTESGKWRGRFGWGAGFALGVAGGIYTKGLLGLVLPGAVLGSWFVIRCSMQRRVDWRSLVVGALAGVAALALVGAWYWALYRRCGYENFHTAFVVNNFGRFSGSQGDHVGSPFYYLEKLPGLFQPWLILLFPALWFAGRAVWKERRIDLLLVLLGVVVPSVIFSVAAAKRVVYLLPLYSFCALLVGYLMTLDWTRRIPALPWRYGRWIVAVLIVAVGTAAWLVPDWARLWPLLGVVAGLAAWWLPRWRYLLLPCLAALVVASGEMVFAVQYSNRKESLRPLFEYCSQAERSGKRVLLADVPERTSGAAYFYLRRNLPETDALRTDLPAGTLQIIRAKKKDVKGLAFADHHWVIGQ